MDDYKLLGKDEVREIMGGCSDQMAYRVIRELNSELKKRASPRSRARLARSTCWSATLAERPRGEPSNVGNPG